MKRAVVRALGLALGGTLLASCASFRTVIAPPADLADYRAFRVSAYEGTRLSRAKRYLDRHPTGVFAGEVRAAFEAEEPAFFAWAQGSREGARTYLADLPDGPHAAAALALLAALESDMQDAELRDLARKVRFEDAKLEAAAAQRRAIPEAILGALGALLDESVYGRSREEAPAPLRAVLAAEGGSTWGGLPPRRERDLFFLLPTRPERESRLLTLVVELVEAEGLVRGGRITGSDMFVRWAEADLIVRLDPDAADDRTEAFVHAQDRLEGALERRFPSGSCTDSRRDRELYHRQCGGWEAVVVAGEHAGDDDVIMVRGPQAHARSGEPR
jgi:hypothetical protein